MVVHTSALVTILLLEPDAQVYADAIAQESSAVISAASYVELTIVALTRGTRGRAEVEAALADALIGTVPCDHRSGAHRRWRLRKVRSGRHPASLNFGDCFAYALAMSRSEALLFKGKDFAPTDVLRM